MNEEKMAIEIGNCVYLMKNSNKDVSDHFLIADLAFSRFKKLKSNLDFYDKFFLAAYAPYEKDRFFYMASLKRDLFSNKIDPLTILYFISEKEEGDVFLKDFRTFCVEYIKRILDRDNILNILLDGFCFENNNEEIFRNLLSRYFIVCDINDLDNADLKICSCFIESGYSNIVDSLVSFMDQNEFYKNIFFQVYDIYRLGCRYKEFGKKTCNYLLKNKELNYLELLELLNCFTYCYSGIIDKFENKLSLFNFSLAKEIIEASISITPASKDSAISKINKLIDVFANEFISDLKV